MGDIFEALRGVEPYRVYQRSSSDTARISLSGELAQGASGVVEVRLLKGRGVLNGFDWQTWSIDSNSFAGELANVPAGGPYTLELRVRDGNKVSGIRRVPGILVGDLWVLAGQSNMDGCGKLINLENPSRYVNCFYYGDYWGVAKDPLCWLNDSIDPVHWLVQDPEERAAFIKFEKAFREAGAGLGVRFGKDMYKHTGVPVGLIMCSHGGTSLEQWSPGLKDKGGESLYGCMLRRIEAVGGQVKGCLWYQGESDALTEGYKDYRENFRSFIESLRSDLRCSDLPFIYVQLAQYLFWGPVENDGWNKVQNDQLLVESDLKNVAMTSAIDSTFSDHIHIDAVTQRRLGARMAKLARQMLFGEAGGVGPRPAEIRLLDDDHRKIIVRFSGVNGSLMPKTGIRGFSLEKDNTPCVISRIEVGDDGTSVILALENPAPEGAVLWYGHGINPGCNLADKAGFAAPVFGPYKLV